MWEFGQGIKVIKTTLTEPVNTLQTLIWMCQERLGEGRGKPADIGNLEAEAEALIPSPVRCFCFFFFLP